MPLMLLMLRAHNNNDASREGKSDRSNGEEDVTRSENKKRIDEITRSYLKKSPSGSSSHCSRLEVVVKKKHTRQRVVRGSLLYTLLLLFQTTTTTTKEEEEEGEEG
jgi:predicted oxidoreductase (fatty acid repression mutant protein)